MQENSALPPLQQFEMHMSEFNLKKAYEYLFYFTKSEQKVYGTLSGNRSPRVLTPEEWDQIPKAEDRATIIKLINQIFSLTPIADRPQKQKELLIISAQKFVVGLIMSGHVHIYQILIREILPLFIKIICNQVSCEPSERDLFKKIRQFCKETILILSVWFPKSFYDQQKQSWFRKAVSQYKIVCQFILYYTNNKIEEYQKLILKLNIGDNKEECLECVNCLISSGKDYSYLKSMPELPEIIREEEEMNSVLSNDDYLKMESQMQRNYRRDLYLESPQIQDSINENNSYYGSNGHRDKSSEKASSYMSNNSKLSDKIRKYRKNRVEKEKSFQSGSKISKILAGNNKAMTLRNLRNSTKSQEKLNLQSSQLEHSSLMNTMELKASSQKGSRISKLKSKIAERRAERETSGLMSSSRISNILKKDKKTETRSLSKNPYNVNENDMNSSNLDNSRSLDRTDLKSRISMLRAKRNDESRVSKTGLNQRLQRKRKQINKQAKVKKDIPKIWHNAYDDVKGKNQSPQILQCMTAKKSSQSTQGTIPRSSEQRIQKLSINYDYQSLFKSELYGKKLSNQMKKLLKKQSLKIQHKKIDYGEGKRAQIKCKSKKQSCMEVKFITNDEVRVIQPSSQLLSQNRNEFIFDFQEKMVPIKVSINNQLLLMPINIISCLKPLKDPHKFGEICQKKSSKFILDKKLFRSIEEIQTSLHLHKFEDEGKETFRRSYQFFGDKVIIVFEFVEKGMEMNKMEMLGHEYNDNIQKSHKKEMEVNVCVMFMKKSVESRIENLMQQIQFCMIAQKSSVRKVNRNGTGSQKKMI